MSWLEKAVGHWQEELSEGWFSACADWGSDDLMAVLDVDEDKIGITERSKLLADPSMLEVLRANCGSEVMERVAVKGRVNPGFKGSMWVLAYSQKQKRSGCVLLQVTYFDAKNLAAESSGQN